MLTSHSTLATQDSHSTSTHQDHLNSYLPQDEPMELVIEELTASSAAPALYTLCYANNSAS
ncbi:hypothetical protein HY68_31425 [Streptomyces sp. AcH 505]|uniref:hypothetical protein n=1 Tax=unclassified Streptomyces TaxID=2593676 RepID=UPI00059239BF|nr:hypothetical protein [Streptomyces sp. NBC_00370]KIF66512.1 hypothetical protein HY68_31425 [Streptomyces sp. AcH 505]